MNLFVLDELSAHTIQFAGLLLMRGTVASWLQSARDAISFRAKPRRIILLGLDGAGKTTLLYKIKLGEAVPTKPTVGFNVETFRYKNVEFTALDVDGQSTLRLRWGSYVENSDTVIFAVNVTDRPRISEGAEELSRAFTFEELRSAKLLVYANKQDQPGCMTIHEIQEHLKLDEVTKNPHHIQAMSAISGKGIYEGLDWLSQHV